MPRLGRQATSDFWAAITAARDLGDARGLGEYAAENLGRLPAWARQEIDRVMNNIQYAEQVRAAGEIEAAGPPGTTTVYSRADVSVMDEYGNVQTGYRTIVTHLEEGEGIDKVLADIDAVTRQWERQGTGTIRPGGPLSAPSVVVAWQVYGPETEPLSFPLGAR